MNTNWEGGYVCTDSDSSVQCAANIEKLQNCSHCNPSSDMGLKLHYVLGSWKWSSLQILNWSTLPRVFRGRNRDDTLGPPFQPQTWLQKLWI